MSDFSLIERQITEREKQLIAEAAFSRGPGSLPDDWDRTREKRIARSRDDFFYFAKEYFPRWFDQPFSSKHRMMIRAALSNDRKIHIYAAPRDFGKTRLFRVFKVWCACFGKKHHYSKASDTIDLVEKDFRYTRDLIKFHPKIVSDFGQLIDESWDTLHSFRVKPHEHNNLGTTFIANSYGVTPRGELGETRVDFEEFDDFEDFEGSLNPDLSRNKLEVIERDFHPALSEDGCGIYLGNNARTTCLINLLHQMDAAERSTRHPALTLTVIDAWNERQNRATWHERYAFKSEEKMRAALGVSLNVWNSEYRQKPSPPEGTRFLQKHWASYEKLPADARGVIMCDPAFGETSDFKVFVVLLYSASAKRYYAPEAFVRRSGWEIYFLAMYDAFERWGSRLYWIGWESDFAQAQYLEFRNIYVSTRSKPDLPIRQINVRGAGDKMFRIAQLETPFSLGHILFGPEFLSTADGVEAQSQLIGYEGRKTATHRVDFPDALSSAYRELWKIAMQLSGKTGAIEVGGARRSAERF